MHTDNKILISAILILGIAVLSFNLGSFSGNVGYNVDCEQATAYATPRFVEGGQKIRVTVLSTENEGTYEGVYNEAKVYRLEGTYERKVSFASQNICQNGQYRCDETVFDIQTFPITKSKTWEPGNYVVRIKDVCSDDFTVEAPFMIKK